MDGRGGRCDRREVGGRPGDSRMAAAAGPGTPPPPPGRPPPGACPPLWCGFPREGPITVPETSQRLCGPPGASFGQPDPGPKTDELDWSKVIGIWF